MGADASSPLRQVTSLDSPGDGWDPSASRASSLLVLASFDVNLHFFVLFLHFSLFFHLVPLKLSPGTCSPEHRVRVLEPRPLSALFAHVLCVAQQSFDSFIFPFGSFNWLFKEVPC